MSEEGVGFEVVDEVVLQDLDKVQDQQQVIPTAQGVRVKIVKPSVRKVLTDNSKDALPEGPENPVAYKHLNAQFKLMDGVSVPVYDENGTPTGETKLQYQNKVIFPQRLDLAFWHNPEVKTSDWWRNRQYIHGFKQLCLALGFELKEVRVNDMFLEAIKDREVLIDITQEEEQEQRDGQWVGKGTFRNRIKNLKKWE